VQSLILIFIRSFDSITRAHTYEAVSKFYKNFEHLQTLLAEIEKIFNEPESQLSRLREHFDNITNELNYLKARFGSNIHYEYDF